VLHDTSVARYPREIETKIERNACNYEAESLLVKRNRRRILQNGMNTRDID